MNRYPVLPKVGATRMKRQLIASVAIGSLLTLAGCSSSGDGGSSGNSTAPSGGTGSSATAKAASGTPFVIGTIGSFSGANSSSLGLLDDVSRIWAKTVNASGGINGHPVKLIVKDDGLNPATALQAAKELVEQDHVQAIVGETSQVDSAFASYVASKGVPVIGGNPTASGFLSNPDFFPSGTGVPVMSAGEFSLMHNAGLKKLGLVYCAEAPVCATLGVLAKKLSPLVPGTTVAYTASIAATQPSYTAECLAAKSAGVDALMTADVAPIGPKMMSDCAKIGYKPTQVNENTTTSPEWLKASSVDGSLLVSPNANYTDDSIPAVKEFTDAIKKYEPNILKSSEFTSNTIFPWIGGKLFEKVATTAHLTPASTSAQVKAAMFTVKDETLDGLTPPLTYTSGRPTLVSCYFTQKISGGKFVTQDGGKPTCLTATQLGGLQKALAGA